MSKISRVPVTLTPAEADLVVELLSAMAASDFNHARKTKSAAIRAFVSGRATKARDLSDAIVRRSYATEAK